ncbi:MAG: ABC transporter ATP-binding protein [Lachnoclostridium sp.]|nr:ABC transporter ATP-binding protein [Lachnoclostridium sp.]
MPPISSKTDRPKDKKGAMVRLTSYIIKYRVYLFAAVILGTAGNVAALVGPMIAGKAIDVISAGKGNVNFNKVMFYVVCLFIFYIISSVMTYILSTIMIKLGRKVANDMRKEVFAKLLKLPVSYFDNNQTGDIISRVSYDIDVINTSVSADVTQLITSIITIVGSFIMMFVISRKLIVVQLITLPASILYTRYMTKRTRPLFSARSKKYGQMNGFTEEMFTGQKTIAAYAKEDVMIKRFEKYNEAAADGYYNADYYGTIIGPSIGFINNFSLALIGVFGSLLYIACKGSLGQISSFILYSRKFSGPVNEVANMYNEILSALAAAERVFRLLDEEEETPDGREAKVLKEVKGEVLFENVTFGYEENETVINDFSLTVKPGKVVAIVGATGAGKTTLINLLMRFYDVDGGSIKIDGTDIREYTRDSLRNAFTMVLQDTWVFGGTIRENLVYGNENVTDDMLKEAVKACNLEYYINNMPEGYDTLIREGGNNISKGQKQLLTIARAMLINKHMLILDEATSNVDTRTEKEIENAMLKLMENKTCFVIAHRLSTIENADVILVLKDGVISEQGTHRELLEKGGMYYNMYISQYR